jgi:hypothetical protein
MNGNRTALWKTFSPGAGKSVTAAARKVALLRFVGSDWNAIPVFTVFQVG